MKLSEMLGWEKKVNYSSMKNSAEYREVEAYNIAIESCDREIDKEALAQTLYEKETDNFWRDLKDPYKEIYFMRADYIISTMPTWLKKAEK